MEEARKTAIQMLNLAGELQNYKSYKKRLVEELKEGGEEAAEKLLKGRSREEAFDHYNLYILQLLSYIDHLNDQLEAMAAGNMLQNQLQPHPQQQLQPETKTVETRTVEIKSENAGEEPKGELPSPAVIAKEIPKSAVSLDYGKFGIVKVSKKERKKLAQELGIDNMQLRNIYRKKSERANEEDYVLYRENFYGRIANSFFKNMAMKLSRRHYANLRQDIVRADIKLLSTTYISSMFFTSLVVFLLAFAGTLVYSYITGAMIVNAILRSLLMSLVLSFAAFFVYYNYPSFVASSRRRAIKNDLPFVIIHMAAVAGSGARPVAMFHLVLTTGEYKGVEMEIKRILNYVNLFGYNLTSALRAVSITTPSKEFKDFLYGIVSVVESGGDLKGYLNGKADDAMNNYKLERRKYVETISTYSDIYIGVLLAAPLLFIVTLTIINLLGGEIAGMTASSLASIGTYIGMPVLNILFILFLNIIQPEV